MDIPFGEPIMSSSETMFFGVMSILQEHTRRTDIIAVNIFFITS